MSDSTRIGHQWWESKANIESIRDYAIQSGLLIKASNDPGDGTAVNISTTLLPSKFPQELFSLASSIAPDINELLDAVSRDHAFLNSVLKSAMKTDEFTKRLFEIHEKVRSNDFQTCLLAINRSDYMVEYEPGACESAGDQVHLRQIEINTIASGLLGLSQNRIQQFHQYVHSRHCSLERQPNIPQNCSLTTVAEGIAYVVKEYGKKSHVLFVVVSGDWNMFDQRCLEYELWNKYHIPTIRKTLTEIGEEAYLGADNELKLKSGEEISVVYYRAGYSPAQYPTEKEWAARLLMESSRASNCPTVTYQLVGTKKIQQVLVAKAILEKFVSDISVVEKIQSTFAGLYSLELGEEGDKIIEKALKEPEKFVAKPQREGGGNNFYGDQVRALLEEIHDSDERAAYILMDKVNPLPQPGFILPPGATSTKPVQLVSELGIFGVFVRKGDAVLMNKSGGYLLRSKPADVNEGGVSAGVGSLDAPDLLPIEQYIKHCVGVLSK